jgi:hypothetical protein
VRGGEVLHQHPERGSRRRPAKHCTYQRSSFCRVVLRGAAPFTKSVTHIGSILISRATGRSPTAATAAATAARSRGEAAAPERDLSGVPPPITFVYPGAW